MFALCVHPISHHPAPIRGVEDDKGITHLSIDQRPRSTAFGNTMAPTPNHHGMERRTHRVAPMDVLRLLRLARGLRTASGLDSHPFGAQTFLARGVARLMIDHSLTHGP
jgi:hypothetical protein